MALIFPSLAVDLQENMEILEFLAKSADPPMPFMILVPKTWVLFTLPQMSASMAVFMAIRPRRSAISGWFEISSGRRISRDLKKS